MGYSTVDVQEEPSGAPGVTVVYITARGGTRRQRGAAIAAEVRKHPGELSLTQKMTYSETYGFQTATYARYCYRTNTKES